MVMPFHNHHDDSTFDYDIDSVEHDIDYIIDDYIEHELHGSRDNDHDERESTDHERALYYGEFGILHDE